jgi:hypothetical protein
MYMPSAPPRRNVRCPIRSASQSTQSGVASIDSKNRRSGSGASGTLAIPPESARSNSGRNCFVPASDIQATSESMGSSPTLRRSPNRRHCAESGFPMASIAANELIAAGTGCGRSGWRAGIGRDIVLTPCHR